MSRKTFGQRAAAGAKLLDDKYGRSKWSRIVKLTRLDQGLGGFNPSGDDCGCIAAQLDAHTKASYGSYSSEITRLFGSYYDEHDRYNLEKRNGFNVYENEGFDGLTEAWKNEVRSRR